MTTDDLELVHASEIIGVVGDQWYAQLERNCGHPSVCGKNRFTRAFGADPRCGEALAGLRGGVNDGQPLEFAAECSAAFRALVSLERPNLEFREGLEGNQQLRIF